MKAIAKAITHNDLNEAVEELRDTYYHLLETSGRVVRSVDWESVAPKIIMGIMVLYGFRNRKLISTIVSSAIIGMITKRVSANLAKA